MNPSGLDNAISALEHAISTLEARSDSLDFLFKAWTALVVIGVAIEVIVVVKEHRDAHRAWRRASIRSPEKPSRRFLVLQLVGPKLVTAGVAGELWVSVLLGHINSKLRINNKQLVGLVSEKAEFANELAKGAEERAGQANERASKNEKKAAALQKEAEDEHLRRVEIERELILMGSRESLLQGEGRRRLIEALTPFAGQKVEIRTCQTSFNLYFIDQEAMGLAMALSDIFLRARWSLGPPARENCGGKGLAVEVSSKSPDSTRKAANALASALRAVSIVVAGGNVAVSDFPRDPQVPLFENGKRVEFPPLGTDTIVVKVLTHP